jgi:hypothetical protein
MRTNLGGEAVEYEHAHKQRFKIHAQCNNVGVELIPLLFIQPTTNYQHSPQHDDPMTEKRARQIRRIRYTLQFGDQATTWCLRKHKSHAPKAMEDRVRHHNNSGL